MVLGMVCGIGFLAVETIPFLGLKITTVLKPPTRNCPLCILMSPYESNLAVTPTNSTPPNHVRSEIAAKRRLE